MKWVCRIVMAVLPLLMLPLLPGCQTPEERAQAKLDRQLNQMEKRLDRQIEREERQREQMEKNSEKEAERREKEARKYEEMEDWR